MGYQTGQPVSTVHKVIDANGVRVPGLDATNFAIDLLRDGAAASEAVTVLGTSSTGVYEFRFTPQTAGTYALLVQELNNFPSPYLSTQQPFEREWRVGGVGEEFEPSYANAFCSQADIERYAQLHFLSTSEPTDTEVRGFAEEIAARIMAQFPSGVTITPSGMGSPLDVSTDAGRILEDLLRQANAIGAASRAKQGAFSGEPPNESPVPQVLWGLFLDLAGGYDPVDRKAVDGAIPAFIRQSMPVFGSGRRLSFTQVSDGEVAAYVAPAGLTESLAFEKDTRF